MSRSRKPRSRLQFDTLESRALMTVILNPFTHVLELTGTNMGDTFTCSQVGTVLTVNEGPAGGGNGYNFDLASVSIVRIAADLMDGSDSMTCTDSVLIPVTADGGIGGDFIRGGGGADSLFGNDGGDGLDGGAGNDRLDGGDHNDVLTGGIGDDTLTGGDGNDHLNCGDGTDVADGGANNDTISGGIGNDTLTGSSGIDRIHGDSDDDHIYGVTENDFLWGDKGFDYIDGGEDDNDQIWGGTENDTLLGASGNDTVLGESGDDSLLGGAGNDSLNGGDGQDTLDGGTERDTVDGGNGIDSLSGGTGNDTLSGDGIGAALPGDDILFGGEGNDVLNGDAMNDTLDGETGRDTLNGGGGNDTLRGGDGNDSIRGGTGNDRAYGGADTDRLFGDADEDQLFGDEGTDTLDGGSHDDILVSIDNDTLDDLWGRGGFDSFWVDDNAGVFDDVRDESVNETETNLHFVDAFANVAGGADKTLNGDGIADPGGGESSANFAGKPLFSAAGPVVADVDQGDLADCWLLASLAAAVNVTPNVIRQTILDAGDGTYVVDLQDQLLGTHEFFRVDTDLPVTLDNSAVPQFAKLGDDNSLWVALVEKAWATDKSNDYLQLESNVFDPASQVGTSFYPLGQIGGTNRNVYPISDGSNVLGDIAANGWAGTYWTRRNESEVESAVASHCYAIISLGADADGNGIPDTVTLYNPNGVDRSLKYNEDGTVMVDDEGNQVRGTVDGNDDGFVTLTIDQFTHDAQGLVGAITADFNRYL